MTLADRVVTLLKADATVAGLASTRIYPEDIRAAGPDAHPEAWTATGYWQVTVCVDDAGGVAAPLGPSGSYANRLVVWIFGESSHRASMETLANRIVALLHRWQDTTTKALLTYGSSTGYQPDPSPQTGALNSITFGVSGIFLGIRS